MEEEERILSRIGKQRLVFVHTAKQFLEEGIDGWRNASVEIDAYYSSLPEGTPPQIDLKQKFDKLAIWKNKQLKRLEEEEKQTDPLRQHEIILEKENINWTYEKHRWLECHINLYNFKTYKDEAIVEHPL